MGATQMHVSPQQCVVSQNVGPQGPPPVMQTAPDYASMPGAQPTAVPPWAAQGVAAQSPLPPGWTEEIEENRPCEENESDERITEGEFVGRVKVIRKEGDEKV